MINILATLGLNNLSTPLTGRTLGPAGKSVATGTAGTDGSTGTGTCGAVGKSSSISKSWACNESPSWILAGAGSTPTISPGIPGNN